MKYWLFIEFLIGEAFISIDKVDNTTLGKAVFLNVVLHDTVIFMGIDADV